MTSPKKLLALLCLVTAFTAAPTLAMADVSVVIGVAPPLPYYYPQPAARSGYVWSPGYWQWQQRRHVWIDGRWLHARPGYRWVPESWHQRGSNYQFEPGRWQGDRHFDARSHWGNHGRFDRHGDDHHDHWHGR
ncbi:MAG TPA: YXWGXW repeat-containing protein [Methylophilaceae bacterium]|nr:YXWGXW repeat-containing protein [Methylophilaceae bacterium]